MEKEIVVRIEKVITVDGIKSPFIKTWQSLPTECINEGIGRFPHILSKCIAAGSLNNFHIFRLHHSNVDMMENPENKLIFLVSRNTY